MDQGQRAPGGRLMALAQLRVSIVDGAAVPTEFRIFSMGINESEKGSFVFDDVAAESVMAEYQRHGKTLLLDFNHGMAAQGPAPEQAIAAGEFVPEARADGLWATAIKWTDRARAFLEAKEYRYYSPMFEFDVKTGRITRLINCALTNLPALDGIAPLVAASMTTKGTTMPTQTDARDEIWRMMMIQPGRISGCSASEREQIARAALSAQAEVALGPEKTETLARLLIDPARFWGYERTGKVD